MYTIRKTATGWELVAANGDVVARFDGTEEGAYYEAVAHLGTIVAADRARAAAGDPIVGDDAPADDGLLPERWTSEGTPGGGIAFQETLPAGRDFTECAWTWRDPAVSLVPLMLQVDNEGGHWGSTLAGFVEEFTLADGTVGASGRFYNNAAGMQFRDLLLDGRFFGVSVDPSEAIVVQFECTNMDEYGWCLEGVDKFTEYEIAGLTGVPFPGFATAAIMLADAGAAAPVAASHSAPVRASASVPVRPPRDWFELAEPALGQAFLNGELGDEFLVDQGDGGLACPLQITDEGRVFGHIARLGQCHVGDYWGPGVCATAPPSKLAYAPFHVGHVICADGADVATGALTVGCEHSTAIEAWKVQDHYANAGSGWADVRVIDGQFGPWACGALRPDVDERQLRVLRALSLSGDWVEVGGALELVGCLAVNTPGFPIARESIKASGLNVATTALKASSARGRTVKLTAAGVVQRCPECQRRRAEAAQAARGERDPRLDQLIDVVSTIERRTRHLVPSAAAALRARVERHS